MASKEEQPHQTWVLRVSIHCEGCKKKVKKILQNVSGVFAVEIDSKQNKVTVTGSVDADTLIRRLAKSGKQAVMWPEKKPANPNPISNPTGKNKEKEQEATGEKEQPAAEKVPIKDKTPADTISETPSKPAEKEKKPAETVAEPAETETPENSSTKEEDKKPDKSSESDSKPAGEPETSSKAGRSGKEKGKKPAESSTPPVTAPPSSQGHVRNLPPHQLPPHQAPAYQHPVYAVSYNTAQPAATSHSYYAAMPPAPPQNYIHSEYSQQPPRSEDFYGSNYGHYSASPTGYSSQRDQNYYGSNYYSSESYSGSMGPSPIASTAHPSRGPGLDLFSDENANSCKIM